LEADNEEKLTVGGKAFHIHLQYSNNEKVVTNIDKVHARGGGMSAPEGN